MAFSPMLDTSMEQGVSQARPCEAANPTRGEADAGNPGSPEGTQTSTPLHHKRRPGEAGGQNRGNLGEARRP
jgi:hypothetical protein